MTAKTLLPEDQRGSLVCVGLRDHSRLDLGSCVVLTRDIPAQGLTAGMAGVIRELPEGDGADETCRVEFGEPEDRMTVEAWVARSWLRAPRPGDLLECFCS